MSNNLPSKHDDSSDSELEESLENQQTARSIGLDLGDDCLYNAAGRRLQHAQDIMHGSTAASNATRDSNTKREDNPFSFKHFLRDCSNSTRSYQSMGARPKVQRENRSKVLSSPENSKRESENQKTSSEFPSALPDFVQDHLVIEQCYLGNKACAGSSSYDLNLPDFTQTDQLSEPAVSRSTQAEGVNGAIPLDLPGLPVNNVFPLDLPFSATIADTGHSKTPNLAEVGNSTSLPDFLTDGPVRSGGDGLPISPSDSGPIKGAIKSDSSRCIRCSELRSELAAARQRASRAEDEADRYCRKATVAENTVIKLKQELKTFKAQNAQLRHENKILKSTEEAAGGAGNSSWNVFSEISSQNLAQELRTAASSAEHSLRQLLTGVDNLRMMASTLENMHRIEENTDRLPSRDDNSGPAL